MAVWRSIIDTLPRPLEAEEIEKGIRAARVLLTFTPALARPYKITVTLADSGKVVETWEQTYTRRCHDRARAAVPAVKIRVDLWLKGLLLSEVRPPRW